MDIRFSDAETQKQSIKKNRTDPNNSITGVSFFAMFRITFHIIKQESRTPGATGNIPVYQACGPSPSPSPD